MKKHLLKKLSKLHSINKIKFLNFIFIFNLFFINSFESKANESIGEPQISQTHKTREQIFNEQMVYVQVAELIEDSKQRPDFQIEIVDDLNGLQGWLSDISELEVPDESATDEEIEIYEYLRSLMDEYQLYLAGGPKALKRSCSALGDDRMAQGKASYYGKGFHGRKTANGERFNKNDLTAAHKTIPFNSIVEVTYRGKTVLVRINDAGPYHGNRIIDLSEEAARQLGMIKSGTGTVTLKIITCGKKKKKS